MRFPYLARIAPQPVYPLGGATVRHYPVFSATVTGPASSLSRDGLLDSGADDTIFPSALANQLGIDLRNAPVGTARAISGSAFSYRYAHVTLRISDGSESCEWPAVVGFLDLPIHWALLGQTGFLQFFDVQLLGARQEVVLAPNANFVGQHTVHSPRQGPP
jgi:hypothetical protein